MSGWPSSPTGTSITTRPPAGWKDFPFEAPPSAGSLKWGFAVLSQSAAWQVYEELQKDERVIFLPEPSGLEERWRELLMRRSSSVNLWTDCYLRAFAEVRGIQVSTFDRALAAAAQSGALLLS